MEKFTLRSWWEGLSGTAKAGLILIVVCIGAALGELHYNGIPMDSVPVVIDSAQHERDSAAEATAKRDRFVAEFKLHGELMGRSAVRLAAKDPESVEFLDQTFEAVYPGTNVYAAKWLITATNSFGGRVQAYGVASVHYKGGDMNSTDNWEVTNARIIDEQ